MLLHIELTGKGTQYKAPFTLDEDHEDCTVSLIFSRERNEDVVKIGNFFYITRFFLRS
jgi:hypothetical protein